LAILAMSCMSQCSISLCTIFTKSREPRPMWLTHHPVGHPRGDLLEIGAAQLPRETAPKNETSNAAVRPTLNQIFSIRPFFCRCFSHFVSFRIFFFIFFSPFPFPFAASRPSASVFCRAEDPLT
jgi:Na+/melibiose symporter-like transporter